MKIERITLQNFRCFENVQLAFDPQLTVIVALNGQGKSSLLDAIKIALWPYIAGFDLGSMSLDTTGIQIDDVFREKLAAHQMEWRLPCVIESFGAIEPMVHDADGTNLDWHGRRLRDSVKRSSKTKNNAFSNEIELYGYAQALENGVFANGQIEADELPMLGYYGTGRLWSQKKLAGKSEKVDQASFSRTWAYRDCLAPSSSYKDFAQWYTRVFKALRDAQIRNLEKKLGPEAKVADDLLAPVRAVQQAIDVILEPHTGWHWLEYSAEHDDLVLEHPEQGKLKVSQLSDGIRNMLALVGDIAYRCYKLNTHHGDKAALLTHGIVMIDEIDMHLHPEWQQTVLPDLQRAFPNIQFIVTTHSPQVLSSIDAHCIRRLDWELDEESGRKRMVVNTIDQQTMGVASSDVLASVMGIDPVPDVEPARQLSHYMALIQQNLHEEPGGMALRAELNAHFGANHPKMLECDRLIRLQAFKRKLPLRETGDA
ncbi:MULTISPECIES: AAA family ATPase [Janthinobacterium]|uniref:AAA family ATPase n=1 Tax=Janthinobacterium TaxID=29580 RepID=UPI0006920CA5|nr:AAA family ATPase [Janthinobacterium sp. RA13]